MDTPQHMKSLYRIITRTTQLDYEFWDLIKMHFGLETQFGQKGEILNMAEIILFEDTFLKNMGFYTKWKLTKKIMKDGFAEEIEIPQDMKHKIEQFYNIRNVFAHSLLPNQILQKLEIRGCGTFANLEDVDKKHKELYKSIMGFIIDNTTQKIDLE